MSWQASSGGHVQIIREVGYRLRIDPPDSDNDVGFAIDLGSRGCCAGYVWAFLDVDDRRKLIEWLQACTSE